MDFFLLVRCIEDFISGYFLKYPPQCSEMFGLFSHIFLTVVQTSY